MEITETTAGQCRRVQRSYLPSIIPRAQGGENEDEEARVEAMESMVRANKKGTVSTTRGPAQDTPRRARAEWKEGSLLPEGWEEMNPLEKVTELYLGERGFLYWSTQLAIGGVVLLIVAWIGFRFIGPALGLYQLANDLNTPNF